MELEIEALSIEDAMGKVERGETRGMWTESDDGPSDTGDYEAECTVDDQKYTWSDSQIHQIVKKINEDLDD